MKCFIIVFFAQFRQFSRICALQTPQNEHNIDFSAQFNGRLLPFYRLLAQRIYHLHLVKARSWQWQKASCRKIPGFASSGRQSLIGRFLSCLYPTHRPTTTAPFVQPTTALHLRVVLVADYHDLVPLAPPSAARFAASF